MNRELKTHSSTTRRTIWLLRAACAAREFTGRATEAAKRADEKETAAGYEVNEAQREAEFGNDAEARRAAETALTLAKDRDTKYGAAVALALSGAADRAQSLAAQLDKDFPDDTFVQYLYLPTIRGAIAVNQKDSCARAPGSRGRSPL